jgi:hypothetical protein
MVIVVTFECAGAAGSIVSDGYIEAIILCNNGNVEVNKALA